MTGAGRSRGDIDDSSPVRTNAQSRAQLESPRARVPYIAESRFSLTSMMRGDALAKYWRCFPSAYGHRCSRNGRHRPRVDREAPDTVHHSELQFPSLFEVGPSTFDHTNPVLVRRVVTCIPGHHAGLMDSITSRRTTPHPQHPGIF